MTFVPIIEKIKKIHEKDQRKVIEQLDELLIGDFNVYIDYANVIPWQDKLGWKIDLRRLKQFLFSFNNCKNFNIYHGTLEGNAFSEEAAEKMTKLFADGFKTKPVKIMKQSIDATSIDSSSTSLLDNFIRRCLLMKYDVETIEYLNSKFKDLNAKGTMYIEDRKCNFDVEIGRDMLLDFERNLIETYVLWSGDSDFYDPIRQLLEDGKKVILFATSRKVARELNELQAQGLFIFEIKKIKNYICWNKDIDSFAL